MKQLLLFIVLLLHAFVYSQMPTDGNYSNWDWENQSQENWRTKYGNNWTDIRPPFAATTPRLGTMSDVFFAKDYTKAKGWKLVWAQFDGTYPWFALYNTHKSIIRVFFYLEDNPFTEVLATLSYQDYNNPCLLSFAKEYQSSNDAYYNNSASYDNDMIAVVIRKLAPESWGTADFPILYDKYITDSKYNNKKWEFTFYGCGNYEITLAGQSTYDPKKGSTDAIQSDQHTIITKQSAITENKLIADQAKLLKEIPSVEGFVKSMKDAAGKIDDKSAKFLVDYKNALQSTTVQNISGVINSAPGVSSAADAILGFVKLLSGSFTDSSTKPLAVTEYLYLQGSMNIKCTLGGNTLSIPGLSSTFYPDPGSLKWTPFNCPMGIFSLEKTPKIKVTSSYERYGSIMPVNYLKINRTNFVQVGTSVYSPTTPILIIDGGHPLLSGYPGKVKKYKFDDDVVVAQQKISGLNLIDLNFAIVCKANGVDKRHKYSIKERYIAYHTFYDLDGKPYSCPFENPVYKALEDGRFIIHKFDENNNEVYFGTPFMSGNKLKGVVFEVPEDTEVKLAVYAKFCSDKYPDPIIFKALYNMTEVPETAQMNRVVYTQEQTNFRYSEYYNSPVSIGLSPSYDTMSDISKPTLYPNPTTGALTLSNPTRDAIEEVSVYTATGQVMIRKKSVDILSNQFDISQLPAGVYFVNLRTASKTYTVPIILKK